MKIQTNELLESFKNELSKKNLIITGLDYKPEYKGKDSTTEARYYIRTSYEDHMPAVDIKVPKEVFEKVQTQKLMYKVIKLTDFVELKVGFIQTNQFNSTLWFSATGLTTNQSFTPNKAQN